MPNVFVLKDHLPKVEKFEVEINGKVYSIPNGKNLKRKDLAFLNKIEGGDTEALYDFLGQFIGQDVADDLDLGELEAIYTAWSKSVQEANGVSLGES